MVPSCRTAADWWGAYDLNWNVQNRLVGKKSVTVILDPDCFATVKHFAWACCQCTLKMQDCWVESYRYCSDHERTIPSRVLLSFDWYSCDSVRLGVRLVRAHELFDPGDELGHPEWL